MALTTAQRTDIDRIVPEFAALSDTVVEGWLGDAATELNASSFGVLWTRAQTLYAGHLYTLSQRGAAGGIGALGGAVSQLRDRSWSVGFEGTGGASGSPSASLRETTYGRLYLQARRAAGIGSARVLS